MLKKPTEHFGKQVGVPGAYWEGRMSAEERKTRFMCTTREFELIHKWEDGCAPSAAFQLQEMGATAERGRYS